MLHKERNIQPVILAGGAGTRLWPLSRANHPKQIQSFLSSYTLLQETILRVSKIPNTLPPCIIANSEHRFIIAEQLKEIGITEYLLVLEPLGKNTAPSATIAALIYADRADTVLAVFPADHYIEETEQFQNSVLQAAHAAQENIVLFGVAPTEPHTGYGYIKVSTSDKNILNVVKFTEKPSLERAQHYLQEGNYLWNSGIFFFRADIFLNEVKTLQPEILKYSELAYHHAQNNVNNIVLEKSAFAQCPAISIDYAVMEHTTKAVALRINFKWNDIGNWDALWKISQKDADNNVIIGDIITHEVQNSYIRAEDKMVTVVGIDNLIVVETADAVLIAQKGQAEKITHIVDHLKENKRPEQHNHLRCYRPWGYFETLDTGSNFQVKRLCVNPGAKLSLQMHYHRAEHWIITNGTALITCGEEQKLLGPNQSTYIPMCTPHRLENPGKVPLYLIEVQSGNYLEEDDIIRFEDTYDRIQILEKE